MHGLSVMGDGRIRNMPSIEQSTAAQFARIFDVSDWRRFRMMAELNLREATVLKNKNMDISSEYRLIARNSRKRLLIGVGTELLLKAIYLQCGYCINRPRRGLRLQFPRLLREISNEQLSENSTVTLNALIQSLHVIVGLTDRERTLRGLRIAKVFRNKEGHATTAHHDFCPSNYFDIATSISLLYADAFGESLEVRFSMAPGERDIWKTSTVANK